MRELFGECQQETTELIVDMEPEPELIKQVTIDEEEALKEKARMREKQKTSTETTSKCGKSANSEKELRLEDKEGKDPNGGNDSHRHGYKRGANMG